MGFPVESDLQNRSQTQMFFCFPSQRIRHQVVKSEAQITSECRAAFNMWTLTSENGNITTRNPQTQYSLEPGTAADSWSSLCCHFHGAPLPFSETARWQISDQFQNIHSLKATGTCETVYRLIRRYTVYWANFLHLGGMWRERRWRVVK